jgi:hypothetical protein
MKRMKARGYVSVEEAARLVAHPCSNIYHWVASGELRKESLGSGPGSVFICLSDLMLKIPGMFGKPAKPTGAAPTAPKAVKRDTRQAARKRAS